MGADTSVGADSANNRRTIAVVLKGYPRLSETFIAQELLGLEKAGFSLKLISMRHPTDKARHPVHDEIKAPVNYLPEYLHDEPMRVFRAWRHVRTRPGYKKAFRAWLAELKSDMSRNRVRRFGQALVLAHELPNDIDHLHAHFIHTPASVTRYTALVTGLNWTCSAHAKDIWTSGSDELSLKLATAQWVVTCTKTGWERLRELSSRPDSVHLSYHGLDLDRFAGNQQENSSRDGSDPENPVRLVTVCRAVEKKGLDTLIEAFSLLPENLHWRWTHIGSGELVAQLKEQAETAGVAQNLTWLGARPQTEVLETYRTSDIFVLPCRIAKDGDRDGLPNVIVEAQSQSLACVSTNTSGVPELIENKKNGLLCEADDPSALAGCLQELIENPKKRATMGSDGNARVRKNFDHHTSISYLSDLFKSVIKETN